MISILSGHFVNFLGVHNTRIPFANQGLVLVTGENGNGKALACDTPIPTPNGWKAMGDLAVGDHVFDERGVPTVVVATTEVMHKRPCFAVKFSDGEEIIADKNHLWWTLTASERQAIQKRTPEFRLHRRALRGSQGDNHKTLLNPSTGGIRTTTEIAETLFSKRALPLLNHAVPVAGPLILDDVNLPIPPYILGLWLGDGTASKPQITALDTTSAPLCKEWEHYGKALGLRLKRTGKAGTNAVTLGIVGKKGRPNPFTIKLRALGIFGKSRKSIPRQYLRASYAQRLALLQGLMDTDGGASKSGQCDFTTTHFPIAEGVGELLASLGIKCKPLEDVATLNGREIGPKWRFLFTTALPVFRLQRKASRQKQKLRGTHQRRYIASVTKVPSVPVRCIQVAAPKGLFLAGRGMIPTHNSSLFIEGPYYGLFGSSVRYVDKPGQTPGDRIIRTGEKAFAVILEINVDGEVYTIARCKRFKKLKLEGYTQDFPDGLSVWQNGQDHARGAKSDTQEWLNKLYGMGPSTYLSSNMFTAETMRFPLLTDSKKKEVLDELLQLGILDEALQDTKTRKTDLDTEVVRLKNKMEFLESQIPEIREEIKSAQASNDSWDAERAKRLTAAKTELAKAVTAFTTAQTALAEIREALQTAQTEYAARHKKLESAKEIVQTAREKFLQEKAALDSKVFNQRQVCEGMRNNLAAHTSLMGMPCPKCKQAVPHNAEWVKENEDAIAVEDKKLETLTREQTATNARSDELKAAQSVLAERNAKLTERQRKIEKARKLIDTASDAVRDASSKTATCEARVEAIAGETNPFTAQLEKSAKHLRTNEESLVTATTGAVEKARLYADERLMETCFGPKGCRVLLLEKVTPSLNLAASNVRTLLDTQLVVSFNVRSDEQAYAGSFEVIVDNPGKSQDYRGDSSGERRRVDMIMMFSLLGLASQRGAKSHDQAIFDEAFDTLDERGQKGVLNLLRHEAAKRSSLFALTHEANYVKGSVAKVWNVLPNGEVDFG